MSEDTALYKGLLADNERAYAHEMGSVPRRPAEIAVLIEALKDSLDYTDKAFTTLQERLSPISSSRSTPANSDVNEKRGADTPLGAELGRVLDRVIALRERIERATDSLEI